eukprot:RCo029600
MGQEGRIGGDQGLYNRQRSRCGVREGQPSTLFLEMLCLSTPPLRGVAEVGEVGHHPRRGAGVGQEVRVEVHRRNGILEEAVQPRNHQKVDRRGPDVVQQKGQREHRVSGYHTGLAEDHQQSQDNRGHHNQLRHDHSGKEPPRDLPDGLRRASAETAAQGQQDDRHIAVTEHQPGLQDHGRHKGVLGVEQDLLQRWAQTHHQGRHARHRRGIQIAHHVGPEPPQARAHQPTHLRKPASQPGGGKPWAVQAGAQESGLGQKLQGIPHLVLGGKHHHLHRRDGGGGLSVLWVGGEVLGQLLRGRWHALPRGRPCERLGLLRLRRAFSLRHWGGCRVGSSRPVGAEQPRP